ncbi:MAG: AmpG family muropeptide MFS transporter [Deltaproteobacteria bacterium]|nr:AmpG family muropeptide MFS transporter [Deltaproteobacteria bacterium]
MKPQSHPQLSLPLKLLVVGVLYFAEGIPFGFVYTTLSFYMRGQGVPLEDIGILSLLGLAWSFKFFWSPLADRFGSRAAWLVPAQVAIIACLLALAFLAGKPVTLVFWLLVGLLCVASATQDLAVDAYSIDILEVKELGLANGIRNGAYRVGVLSAGAGLLIVSDRVGWSPAFVGVSVMMAAMALTVLIFRPFRLPRPEEAKPANPAVSGPLSRFAEALRGLKRHPYIGVIILFTLLYKAGDALMGSMVSPFWKDQGFSATEFGVVSGIFGSVATILGGLLGGIFTSRCGIGPGLWALGLFQAVSNLGYWVAAFPGMTRLVLWQVSLPGLQTPVAIHPIYLASQGESLSSGLGSAAFMAFLMSLCDKRFSATQYAFFAMLFGLSGRIMGYLGGWGAKHFGYGNFFFLTFLAALPAFALLPWILPVVRGIEGKDQ